MIAHATDIPVSDRIDWLVTVLPRWKPENLVQPVRPAIFLRSHSPEAVVRSVDKLIDVQWRYNPVSEQSDQLLWAYFPEFSGPPDPTDPNTVMKAVQPNFFQGLPLAIVAVHKRDSLENPRTSWIVPASLDRDGIVTREPIRPPMVAKHLVVGDWKHRETAVQLLAQQLVYHEIGKPFPTVPE